MTSKVFPRPECARPTRRPAGKFLGDVRASTHTAALRDFRFREKSPLLHVQLADERALFVVATTHTAEELRSL